MRYLALICVPAALAAACSSAPSAPDPEVEQQFREIERRNREIEERMAMLPRVLNDLDKALDKYAEAEMSSGNQRADDLASTLAKFITEMSQKHFHELVAAADQVDYPRNRAIAVAALGFSGRPEALDPLLNAAADENPEVASNAVFGLGILGDTRTPPSAIAAVMNNAELPETMRTGAAWALYKLQLALYEPTKVKPIWIAVLQEPLENTDPGVLVSALRGIGLLRDPEVVNVVAKYVSHPMPMVRQVTAISLGRIGSDQAVPVLLTLIGPSESNENVRLAGRKALQALAGGIDRGYDVVEWKKVFDRK